MSLLTAAVAEARFASRVAELMVALEDDEPPLLFEPALEEPLVFDDFDSAFCFSVLPGAVLVALGELDEGALAAGVVAGVVDAVGSLACPGALVVGVVVVGAVAASVAG